MPQEKNTKQTFALELEAMMQHMPLSKVRVRDLCARCGVERCTFYYHFKDKYDLVAWMLDQDNRRAELRAKPYTRQYFAAGLQLMWERREFYRRAFEDDSQNSIYRYHLAYCISANAELLRRYLDVSELSREVAFEARFFSLGNVGCVATWLRGELEATPEELAASLFDAMPPMLRKAYVAAETQLQQIE